LRNSAAVAGRAFSAALDALIARGRARQSELCGSGVQGRTFPEEDAFGADVDYAMLHKIYGAPTPD